MCVWIPNRTVSAMNDTTSHDLPSSGQLLGFITDHLGFREAVGTDRTTQRVFQGERVRPESIRGVVAQLVRAFWSDGAEGGQRRDDASLPDKLVEVIVELARAWDDRRARLHVELRPQELELAFHPFLRLTALDLGLRLGGYSWMLGLPEPSREQPPPWTFEDGFGRLLDAMLSRTTLRSRAQLAERAEVSANAMSAWSRFDSFPSDMNIERLAIELADDANARQGEIQNSLRLNLLLGWARKELGKELGAEVTGDLIEGALWVASRVWRLASVQRADRGHPLLGELVLFGSQSVLGSEAAALLSKQAPNPLMAADLSSLPSEWTQRLRAWFPIMQSKGAFAEQSRRFFPTDDFDPRAALAEIEGAPTPAVVGAAALTLMNFGAVMEAARLFERLVLLEPLKAQNHYNFAMAHYRAHGPSREVIERAMAECRIAASLDETHVEARLEVASFLGDLGRFDEALSMYAAMKKLAPSSARLECDWGFALMSLGRDLDAAAHFEAATTIDPQYVDAWSNRCFVLNRAGRKREAREAAKRAEFLGDPAARMALDAER